MRIFFPALSFFQSVFDEVGGCKFSPGYCLVKLVLLEEGRGGGVALSTWWEGGKGLTFG